MEEEGEILEHPLGLTLSEAAARLDLTKKVVTELILSGRLQAEKFGKRWYLNPGLQLKPALDPPRGPQASPPRGLSAPRGEDPFYALHTLPDDHVITIYRMKQGKRFFVVAMAPEEFSLHTVKRHWGGGVYLAIGTIDDQVVAQHSFAIDGVEKDPEAPLPSSPPLFSPSTSTQDLQIQQLAGQVQALQQALMALAAGGTNREDGEGRKHWLEEMLLMKQAFAPPPPPPQTNPEESRKRWLEEMMLLKQMFAQPSQPNGIEAISGALMKGVEMAATVSSIGEHEGLGTAIIKGMLPTLNDVVGGIAKNLMHPQILSSSSASTVSPAFSPEPIQVSVFPTLPDSNNSQKEEGLGSSQLELLMPMLIRAARENRDPYPYAAMIASEIPDEAIEQLKSATAEQFQQFVVEINPQLAQYPGWIGELKTAILTELEEENAG